MGMLHLAAGRGKGRQGIGPEIGVTVWGYSLTEIFKILSERIEISEQLKDKGKLLDLYYIPPRYPHGFPSGKPADYFTEKQAREAVDAAGHIIRFCESHLAQ